MTAWKQNANGEQNNDSVSSVQPGFTVLAGKKGYGNPFYVCEYTDTPD